MIPAIGPDQAQQFTRLLHVLVDGERLASDCARWQSSAASEPIAQRFFRSQARHEDFHARLFQGVAYWLAPKVAAVRSRSPAFQAYRQRLESAMAGGRWTELLIGQQIVLEELGEVALTRLSRDVRHRGLPFDGISRLVLRQERAHHNFGLRLIDAELRERRSDSAALGSLVADYTALAERILDEVSPLLESLDADVDDYRDELRDRLPTWADGSVS